MKWEYVYVIKAGNYHKIGYTKDVGRRKKELQMSTPFELETVYVVHSPIAKILESDLHRLFNDNRVRGEWFEFGADDLVMLADVMRTIAFCNFFTNRMYEYGITPAPLKGPSH